MKKFTCNCKAPATNSYGIIIEGWAAFGDCRGKIAQEAKAQGRLVIVRTGWHYRSRRWGYAPILENYACPHVFSRIKKAEAEAEAKKNSPEAIKRREAALKAAATRKKNQEIKAAAEREANQPAAISADSTAVEALKSACQELANAQAKQRDFSPIWMGYFLALKTQIRAHLPEMVGDGMNRYAQQVARARYYGEKVEV